MHGCWVRPGRVGLGTALLPVKMVGHNHRGTDKEAAHEEEAPDTSLTRHPPGTLGAHLLRVRHAGRNNHEATDEQEPTVLRELSDTVGMKVAHVTVERLKKEGYRIRDAGRALLEVIEAFLKADPDTFERRPKASLAPDWADPHWGFNSSGDGVTPTTSQTSGSVLIRADGKEPLKTSRRTD